MHSACSIPSALANQHKYTGQEHRVRDQKDERGRKNKPKSLQTKDVEEVIKACDGS